MSDYALSARLLVLSAGLLVASLFAAPAVAQPIEPRPAEWGEVSAEALKRTAHPTDSNATAIILSDIGESELRRNNTWSFERERRIQLLSESAYEDYGTHTVYLYDEYERIKNIEAATYVLEDGEVVRYELDDDDIFEEEVNENVDKVSFTLPNLELGAIIEYKYEIRSDQSFLQPWQFQGQEPTVYSEYSVKIPEFLKYTVVGRGSEPFAEQNREQTYSNLSNRISADRFFWAVHNAPAIREEAFMTTPNDYVRAIRFKLNKIVDPITSEVYEVMGSWKDVAVDLMESFRFGRELGRHGEVRDLTDETVAGLSSSVEKQNAIYKVVQSRIDWNGQQQFLLKRNLDEVLESGTGSSAEINMLLCSMLQEADVEAYPMLISTRNHGAVTTLYPSVDQFNEVIVAVKTEDGYTFLDATDDHRPAGLLPERALNGQGWLVDKSEPQWVTIPPTGARIRSTLIRASLTKDGTISGLMNVSNKSFFAVMSRNALADSNPEEVVRESLFDTEVALSGTNISNQNVLAEPLKIRSSFSIPNYAQVAGDFIYVKPVIADAITENPLTAEERSFPIDLPSPVQHTYTLSLQLPDGYVVEDLPENKRVRLKDQSGTFVRITQSKDNALTMRIQAVIRKTKFAPSEYDELKRFFAELVATHAEPIVLKKAPEGASSANADAAESASGK